MKRLILSAEKLSRKAKYLLRPIRSPEVVARRVTEKVAKQSFRLFRDREFRRLLKIEQLDKTEQDRIFNEIVVSGLAVAILIFEALKERAEERRSELQNDYFSELIIETQSCYGNMLRKLGVEEEFAGLWRDLIQMRVKEYFKYYQQNKRKIDKMTKQTPWAFIVAFGGYDHITRGKGSPKELGFKLFLLWIVKSAKATMSTL